MATEFNKTYTIVIKYRRDDLATLADTDLEATELRKVIKKNISEVVPASKGILSAHIVGEVTEA